MHIKGLNKFRLGLAVFNLFGCGVFTELAILGYRGWWIFAILAILSGLIGVYGIVREVRK